MRIGLISDTHGYIDSWEKALEIFGDIDFAIHTGDILNSGPFNPRLEAYKPAELAQAMNNAPFMIVFAKGNCDSDVDQIALQYPIESPYSFVYAEGLKIMATHGHQKSEDELIQLGERYTLDIIVRGHTHQRGIHKVGDPFMVHPSNLIIVNPGSATFPNKEDGVRSVGLIEDGRIKIISLEDGAEIESAAIEITP